MIGGVDYRHAVKGDGQLAMAPIPEEQQRRALAIVLGTLKPEFMQLSPRVLARIPPAPPGHPSTAERFPRSTGQMLDPMAMAAVAANMTIRGLLNASRAARLQNRDDGQGVTFVTVLRELAKTVFPDQPAASSVLRRLQRTVQTVLVDRLIDLASNASASANVRALAEEFLGHFAQKARVLALANAKDTAASSHHSAMHRRVQSFLQRQDREPKRAPSLESPPGSPIGSGR
jgi:hypothetical protein